MFKNGLLLLILFITITYLLNFLVLDMLLMNMSILSLDQSTDDGVSPLLAVWALTISGVIIRIINTKKKKILIAVLVTITTLPIVILLINKGPTWCDCKRWHEKENVVGQYGKMPSNFTVLPMPEPEEYADWARCYEQFIELEDTELNKWKENTDCK